MFSSVKTDDIVIVKNGYGRNYLIPNGKAIIATKSAIKVLNENLKQKAFKEKKIIDEAKALADKIIKLKIKILLIFLYNYFIYFIIFISYQNISNASFNFS